MTPTEEIACRACRRCGLPMGVVGPGQSDHPCCDPSFVSPPLSDRQVAEFIRRWNAAAVERDRQKGTRR